MRINKWLADNQYASRREADELIKSGVVYINGEQAKVGDRVLEGDKVEVKGKAKGDKKYYAYNKPRGIVTFGAQEGEEEIKDIADFPAPVYPLGRLDKDSTGLIIMTNDGRLTEKLLRPKNKHDKEYRVTVDKDITNTFIQRMQHGVPIGGVGRARNYVSKKTKVRKCGKRCFDIVLTEGKNQQIRRMSRALGYEVKTLERFRVMNIELNKLRPGSFREIKGKELETFLGELLVQN